jgi:Kef-type K+ transport system membrane component KefB
MTENDFPALRSAVRDSLIGRTIASVTAATIGAASSATSTRLMTSQANEFRGLTAAEAIRTGAIALLTACIAIWALSLAVPLYVSTAIPGTVFLALGLICAAAAASCHVLAEHWPHSRLRRVMAWLRGA